LSGLLYPLTADAARSPAALSSQPPPHSEERDPALLLEADLLDPLGDVSPWSNVP
jgi:hypothetical protein